MMLSLNDVDGPDAIGRDPDGRPRLIVVDDTHWHDADERWPCLLEKLRSYTGFLYSDAFARMVAGVAPGEVMVAVRCAQPPCGRMMRLPSFAPRGDESNPISVMDTVEP